ncbi:MAG: peptidoglycan DD-metalloendopeptidase family protein [Oscillospiraceae bacterium]|nr:peptidoglycan DD-metalloendopeptidase family protein [Oscillospiraceae bacterium]
MSVLNHPDPRTDKKTAGELLVRLGMMVLHSLRAVVRILWFFIHGFLRMLWYMLCQVGRFFKMLGINLRHSFHEHNAPVQRRLEAVKEARSRGFGAVVLASLRFVGGYVFGENGLLRTGFNYILPVISIVFLIGMVHYGLGLDYALAVTVSGEELGVVESEHVFEEAREEARKRISIGGEEADLSYSPVYTLRIVSDNDSYATVQGLADKLLISSHEELTDAWGVYVDGEFIGAVENRDKVVKAMANELDKYASKLNAMVNEVYYTKEIGYQEGVFLRSSLLPEERMIRKLTATSVKEGTYTVTSSDTPQLVAATHGMTEAELLGLNPRIARRFREGMRLKVYNYSRAIPIAYTQTMNVTSFIDYSTIRVETSALNRGVEKVIAKGVIGERTSEVLVTYVDGTEESRKVLSTAITKLPVPEQIGIGTYSAQPASSRTKLSGSGQFGWPVNGGYISDHFGGERKHKGLDIAAPTGTEIYAAEGGTVYRAGYNPGGYGINVIIDHENGYRTLYGHCSDVVAYAGQVVEKGQLIAYVGSTGDSTGPHCHFEVRINNICQNPEDYLRVNAD